MLGVLAERRRDTCLVPELARRLVDGRDRPDAHVLAVEALEPLAKRARREHATELGAQRRLIAVVLTHCELLLPEQLAEAREELRLERRDREHARVARLVDRVAGVPLGENR